MRITPFNTPTLAPFLVRVRTLIVCICACTALQACVVASIVDTAASVAVGAVGAVANVAVGTVKLAGKAVGAVASPAEKATAP